MLDQLLPYAVDRYCDALDRAPAPVRWLMIGPTTGVMLGVLAWELVFDRSWLANDPPGPGEHC